MVFLGILFDTFSMTMSIPPTKLKEFLSKIKKACLQSHISKHQLQSLLGLMSFITSCAPPAQIFMASLLNGHPSLPRHERLQMSDIIKSDLQSWSCFLPHNNGVSIIPPPIFTPAVIVTDACFHGAGGVRHECFHFNYSDHLFQDNDCNINIKEILAITVAFGPGENTSLVPTHLLITSDNKVAVEVITN